MCAPSKPKIDKIAEAPPAPEAPPEQPIEIEGDSVKTKRAGRNSLRIDLAAGGNTSLTAGSGLRI
jgi:hypothetical protein